MINWIATNNTGSYCLKKSHVSHHITSNSHHICSSHIRLKHERKHIDADTTRQQHVQYNGMIQSGLLAVDASFQFVDILDLGSLR